MDISIGRVYEPRSERDGKRILVDRLWPRGLTKEKAAVDLWLKEVAPTTELRKWFGHNPARWSEFQERYRDELKKNAASFLDLKREAESGPITLLFAAKDEERNEAVVLRSVLEREIRSPAPRGSLSWPSSWRSARPGKSQPRRVTDDSPTPAGTGVAVGGNGGVQNELSGFGLRFTKPIGVGRRERLPRVFTKRTQRETGSTLQIRELLLQNELGWAGASAYPTHFTKRTDLRTSGLPLQNESAAPIANWVRIAGRSRQAKRPVAPFYKTNYAAAAVMVFSFASTG
jgi:uncharacterized protein YeaO (DUF488 family)